MEAIWEDFHHNHGGEASFFLPNITDVLASLQRWHEKWLPNFPVMRRASSLLSLSWTLVSFLWWCVHVTTHGLGSSLLLFGLPYERELYLWDGIVCSTLVE
jgi:hypothetical protein